MERRFTLAYIYEMKSRMTFHGMSNLHLISLYQISVGLILLQLSKALHPYCFISGACKVTLILISSLSCSAGFFNKDFFCLCLPWGLATGVPRLQQAYTRDPNLIHFCISVSSVICHCVNWQFVLGGVYTWCRISATDQNILLPSGIVLQDFLVVAC